MDSESESLPSTVVSSGTESSSPSTQRMASLSFSAYLESKEEAAGSSLTLEQSQALNEFIKKLKASPDYKELTLPSEEMLVRFLMARKFEVDRAYSLLFKFLSRFELRGKPTASAVLPLLKTQRVITPPCRDKDGAQLLIFAAKYHDDTSFFAYMDLVHYLLDTSLNSRVTQVKGITLVIDMKGSSWKQFDTALLNKFLLFFQDHFPARLRRVIILSAPKWVSILAKAMTPFMKPKLASKMLFIDQKEIMQYIEPKNLLQSLGGECEYDHEKWVQERVRIESKVRSRGTAEGFLMIKGADGVWKRRWFMIMGTKASVYKSVDDKHPLRIINVERCEGLEEAKNQDKPYCFQLKMDDENHVYCHTESMEGFEFWFTAFKFAVAQDSPRKALLRRQKEIEETERLLREREQEREKLLREERERERERRRAEEERRKREEEESQQAQKREEAQKHLHSKRTNIVQEILWTEQSYVETLKMIIEVFLKPLKEASIVPERQLNIMFPEVQSIYLVNSELLANLDARVQDWSRTQMIGDVFLTMITSLRVYVGLVNGYNNAIDSINRLQQESSQFKAFLEECQSKPECRMIGIAEHLLTPIQRVPRYVMLLADLLKNTDSEHPDFNNLVNALESMKQTADFINEMKRKADSRLRVVEILEEVKGIPEDLGLVAPHRTFMCELDVQELEETRNGEAEKYRPRNKVLRLYLFNDLLMVTSNKSKKKASEIRHKLNSALQHISLTDLPDHEEFTHLIQLQVADQKFFIQCGSLQAKTEFTEKTMKCHPISKLLAE